MKPELQNEITQLGLDDGLMTEFTSFVAVEEQVVTKDGKPQRIEVPVEMPEGVSYEGVFGSEQKQGGYFATNSAMAQSVSAGSAFGSRLSGGIGRGIYAAKSAPAAPPPPMAMPARLDPSANPVTQNKRPTGDRAVLESKLHPALLKAFDCWKKSGESCKSVQAGKVRIEIFMAGTPNGVLDQLKALGFEIAPSNHPEGRWLAACRLRNSPPWRICHRCGSCHS